MSKKLQPIKEVKIGRLHYILDEKSGFWINQKMSDPMSATIIKAELVMILKDSLAAGYRMAAKLQVNIDRAEDIIKELEGV